MHGGSHPIHEPEQSSWLPWCFAFTAVCGLLVSCIPDGDSPGPVASPADLSALELSAGPLQPAFAPSTISYHVLAPNSVTSTTVTATTADPNAKLMVNNQPAVSGQEFGPIPLSPDTTTVSVVVEPPGNGAPKSYTVVITKAGDARLRSLTIAPGTLTPAFDPDILDYTVSVTNTTTSVTVTAAVQDPTSSMSINGVAVPSGSPFVVSGLQVGTNTIRIRVTAMGGAFQDYVIVVTRAGPPSTDASLASAQISASVAGTLRVLVLCPAFTPSVTSYSATPVPNSTTTVIVSATTANPLATLRINGQQATSGTPVIVNLGTGNNSIPVDVTAQAGNTRRYTFTVNRAGTNSNNNNLWALSLSAGTLSPVFCHNTTGYSVATTQTSTTVTATVADPTATLRIDSMTAISGVPFGPINLNKGNNTIRVEVRAQNGSTKTYTITVNRS